MVLEAAVPEGMVLEAAVPEAAVEMVVDPQVEEEEEDTELLVEYLEDN